MSIYLFYFFDLKDRTGGVVETLAIKFWGENPRTRHDQEHQILLKSCDD